MKVIASIPSAYSDRHGAVVSLTWEEWQILTEAKNKWGETLKPTPDMEVEICKRYRQVGHVENLIGKALGVPAMLTELADAFGKSVEMVAGMVKIPEEPKPEAAS